MTFMNLSGQAIGGLLRYFKIDPMDLLVIVDDVQLPLAKLRARARGSAADTAALRSAVNVAIPQRRGTLVETKAIFRQPPYSTPWALQ